MRLLYLAVIFFFALPSLWSQDNTYGEKRERHKVWKKWKSKRQSYNPYLDRKGKNKPSSKMARENKKHVKKGEKAAKKQMRKSRKSIKRADRRRMKG